MKSRINYYKVGEMGLKNMLSMEKYISSDMLLDKKLIELVKIRISQINGCAFCLNMHTQDARKLGETEQRIYLLNAWKETSLYTEQERMALEFAETLTLISTHDISDTLYEKVRTLFDERQYTDLVLLINQMNSWNRIAISMANKFA